MVIGPHTTKMIDIVHDFLRWPLSRSARKRVSDWRCCHRLFMTLLVRDEEEILEQNIRFHAAMGVDGFVVTLHCSVDGSEAKLEKLRGEGYCIHVIHEPDPRYLQDRYVSRMILIAKRQYGADWVINADADEFYYSRQLDLKQSIRMNRGANVLWVDSIFSMPKADTECLDNTFFVTRPFQDFEARQAGIANDIDFMPYIGSQGCCKVIHTTRGFRKIYMGNHDVDVRWQRRSRTSDIRLYHFHVRNFRGFEDKVKRYVEAVKSMPDGVGSHIKRWVGIYRQGGLRAEFERLYSEAKAQFLIDHGVVTNDPSICNFLRHKRIAVSGQCRSEV